MAEQRKLSPEEQTFINSRIEYYQPEDAQMPRKFSMTF